MCLTRKTKRIKKKYKKVYPEPIPDYSNIEMKYMNAGFVRMLVRVMI